MHQRSATLSWIQPVVDGQEIGGIAYFTGSADLTVVITRPFEGFTTSVHMPYFARGVHPDGFHGEYGQARASQLLAYLYVNLKNCACRRRAAIPGILPNSERLPRKKPLTRIFRSRSRKKASISWHVSMTRRPANHF